MVEAGGVIDCWCSIKLVLMATALTAATGDVVLGYAREAGVDGQIIEIEMIQGGNVAA